MPDVPDPLDWIPESLEELAARDLDRRLRAVDAAGPGWVERDGRRLVDFASNDYLGLARDPRLAQAAARAARDLGAGAAASPLITGWTRAHAGLAEALAEFEGTAAATLFPTGFAANLGALVALTGPGDAIYLDRLDHACLVAGARLSGARLRVYPHNDADRLEALLDRERRQFRRVLVATDGVFSMDGDLAPLPRLVDLCERHDATLLVDEAHGTGVLGGRGRGACEALGVEGRVPVKVGTLSKALGAQGGFVAGSRALIDRIHHAAPSFLFSTALAPPAVAAARAALAIVTAEPERRGRLSDLAVRLRRDLDQPAATPPTPIVPWRVGDPGAAVALSIRLEAAGMLAPPIRPPTVPRGTARLRLSLSSEHTAEQVSRLAAELLFTPRLPETTPT
jgi:8-amino-7-oxononanoate synthase